MKPFLFIFPLLVLLVIGPTHTQVMRPSLGHNDSFLGSDRYTGTLTSQSHLNLSDARARRMPDMNESPNINGILYADYFDGADIGAKINAAAATCIIGAPCHILVAPHAQYSFSTS